VLIVELEGLDQAYHLGYTAPNRGFAHGNVSDNPLAVDDKDGAHGGAFVVRLGAPRRGHVVQHEIVSTPDLQVWITQYRERDTARAAVLNTKVAPLLSPPLVVKAVRRVAYRQPASPPHCSLGFPDKQKLLHPQRKRFRFHMNVYCYIVLIYLK